MCECLCMYIVPGYFIFEIFMPLSSFPKLEYFFMNLANGTYVVTEFELRVEKDLEDNLSSMC